MKDKNSVRKIVNTIINFLSKHKPFSISLTIQTNVRFHISFAHILFNFFICCYISILITYSDTASIIFLLCYF